MKKAAVYALALAILAALPAGAANVRTIQNGIDVWHTAGDGTTFVDFSKNPIPKGFFCSKSAAFTGRVVLQGRPLATGTPGELGGADTILQRLDDASFDSSGVATTRVQIRALQLESMAAVKTTCGDFNVRVSLIGEQAITKMRIIKETESSGHFVAPVQVRFKISFLPTNGAASLQRELVRSFSLAPAPNATWGAVASNRAASRQHTLLVDTDSDQIPDAYLPSTSGNFQPGWTPAWERHTRGIQKMVQQQQVAPVYECNPYPDPQCHPEANQAQHCALPCMMPYEP